MAEVGTKTKGVAEGKYQFVEYSVRGIPKKLLRIVIQQNPKHIWYVYKVKSNHVTTIGWSNDENRAIGKARKYIREEIKDPRRQF